VIKAGETVMEEGKKIEALVAPMIERADRDRSRSCGKKRSERLHSSTKDVSSDPGKETRRTSRKGRAAEDEAPAAEKKGPTEKSQQNHVNEKTISSLALGR